MKTMILGLVIAIFTSCGGNNTKNSTNNSKATTDTLPVVQQQADTSAAGSTVKDIIDRYLQVKNAFTNDDAAGAAEAAKSLTDAFSNVDSTKLPAEEKTIFNEIAVDAKEHASHISTNSGNIKHQREHFILLSKDLDDFVKTFGNGGQTLYQDFCPMANNGKGAHWISETRDIKNPYLGKAMPTCGTMKKELK